MNFFEVETWLLVLLQIKCNIGKKTKFEVAKNLNLPVFGCRFVPPLTAFLRFWKVYYACHLQSKPLNNITGKHPPSRNENAVNVLRALESSYYFSWYYHMVFFRFWKKASFFSSPYHPSSLPYINNEYCLNLPCFRQDYNGSGELDLTSF